MKIGIKTLGCKSNRYESYQVFDELVLMGHKVKEIDKMASSFKNCEDFYPDLLIINTCTVTHLADKKSKQAILSFKNSFPKSKLLAFGCAINIGSINALEFPEIEYFAKNRDELLKICEQLISTEHAILGDHTVQTIGRTRALVKIQDGCENFCTYCIIAHARGKEKSFPLDDIIKEVKDKEAMGFKEIIITGINIGKWRNSGKDISDLFQSMLDETYSVRFRISSIEPIDFNEKFFSLFQNPRFCPQIHLSLQSGCDKILGLMNRHYSSLNYLNICEKLYASNPDFAITTDVIVGFPGESEEDFLNTCEFVKKIGFLKIHVFPYSKRNKTPAAKFPNQVLPKIKKERALKLRHISDEMEKLYLTKYIGKNLKVLVEGNKGRLRKGFTENLIPVKFLGEETLRNTFVKVKILGIDKSGKFLEGECI